MNTTDAIQALRAGDFHALLGALDVDRREDIDGTAYGLGIATVAQIGRTIYQTSTATNDQPAMVMIMAVPDEMDPGYAFYMTVAGNQRALDAARQMQREAVGSALGGTLPMGFTV